MRIQTAINHKDRAVESISVLWATARSLGLPQREILSKRAEIWDNVSKCPQWVKSYLHGYFDALQSQALATHVHYYTLPDGRLFSSDSKRADYYGHARITPEEILKKSTHSGHYWPRGEHNAPSPYFVSPMA